MSQPEQFAQGGVVQMQPSPVLARNLSLPDLIQYALSLDPDNHVLLAARDKLKHYVPRSDELEKLELSLMDIRNDLDDAMREIRALKE